MFRRVGTLQVMKEVLTTYQFTRGITKALQRARDGSTVVVTCEGKAPVTLHAYTGDACTIGSSAPCLLCAEPFSHEVLTPQGTMHLCTTHYQKAQVLSYDHSLSPQ